MTYYVAKLYNKPDGPYEGRGDIYIISSGDSSTNIISFVVSSKFEGLVKYHNEDVDWRTPTTLNLPVASPTSALTSILVSTPTEAPYAFDVDQYDMVFFNTNVRNDILYWEDGREAMKMEEFQPVMDFLNFDFDHPGVAEDEHFIDRSYSISTKNIPFTVVGGG